MDETLKPLLKSLVEDEGVDHALVEKCFDLIHSGSASDGQIAAFVTALKVKGETSDDIVAGASILRRRAVAIDAPEDAMDVVGTGGDGIGTWNISTATAFVVAGTGIPVAKHGSRAVSSRSGAAETLGELGINLEAPMELVQRAIDEAGICFLMASRHHVAMRHVLKTRQELGYRTVFNMLGPLSNPAQVKRIMVGVFGREWIVPYAKALQALGATHAIVVHGNDGMDEASTTGETHAALLRDGAISETIITPEQAGVPRSGLEELVGGTPAENAKAVADLLGGATGAYRDIVVLNAAVALYGGGHAQDLPTGAAMARGSLDGGKAREKLDALVRITNEGGDA